MNKLNKYFIVVIPHSNLLIFSLCFMDFIIISKKALHTILHKEIGFSFLPKKI